MLQFLRLFQRGGNSEELRQQSAPGLESGGSGTSSNPMVTEHLPNTLTISKGNSDETRYETPSLNPSSSIFAHAVGTTVSGPAHFASTSTAGNQLTSHFNQFLPPSANIVNAVNQESPPVLPAVPSAPLPSDIVDSIPSSSSNIGTFSTKDTVADAGVEPKDNEIYERLLRGKGRGFALYVPGPNTRSPIAYQMKGIHVGDVGIITSDGGFFYLFNIYVPPNDPINPRILPEDFSPLRPPLTDEDIAEFYRFQPGSYLASASIVAQESESNKKGLHFETSASEGAVLTIPEGAISLDLGNDIDLSDYLEANVRKWYEFVYKVRRRRVPNGQIRLVIGCDKTTAWGIAAVSGMSQRTTSKLTFKMDNTSTSTTTYTWECSGMAEVRVGPNSQEIEALRNRRDDGPPLETKLENQCIFVRTMTATLSDDEWAKLSQNLGKTTVKGLNPGPSSGTTLDPSLGSRPTGFDANSSEEPDAQKHSGQGPDEGTPGAKSYAVGQESGILISTTPASSVSYHPSDHLNQQLLLKFPDCDMVITKDEAWLSTIREDEEITLDPEQLLEQVLASHVIHRENGVLRLDQKKMPSDVQKPSSPHASLGLFESRLHMDGLQDVELGAEAATPLLKNSSEESRRSSVLRPHRRPPQLIVTPQPSKSYKDIPNELWYLIFEFLSPPSITRPTHHTLVKVRGVCHSWRNIAERLIWRERRSLVASPRLFHSPSDNGDLPCNLAHDIHLWLERGFGHLVEDNNNASADLRLVAFHLDERYHPDQNLAKFFVSALSNCVRADITIDHFPAYAAHVSSPNAYEISSAAHLPEIPLRQFSFSSINFGIRDTLPPQFNFSWNPLRRGLPWSQLTDITLDCVLSYDDALYVLSAALNVKRVELGRLSSTSLPQVANPATGDIRDGQSKRFMGDSGRHSKCDSGWLNPLLNRGNGESLLNH